MLTTLIYVMGALSLHFTDIYSQHAFFYLFLPLFNFLFFIFLLWQIIFYFSLNAFSHDHESHFFELLFQLWNLGYEINQHGFIHTFINVSIRIIDVICLFTAVFYYFDIFLDFVQL